MEIEVKQVYKSGMWSIYGPHGRCVPAYYRTLNEAQTDLNETPVEVREAIINLGDDRAHRMVKEYFYKVRGTIPYHEAKKIENREMWREYEVKAESVADFLARYYKPERFTDTLLSSHQADFERDGYDLISKWDSVTGQTVAFFAVSSDTPYPAEIEVAYQCGSCQQEFDKPDDRECPNCHSGNWVKGCIDDPAPIQTKMF